MEQECIPVGCVPSAAVAVSPGGSASVHAGIPAPLLGAAPRTRHPPGSRPPWEQTHPPGAAPWKQTPQTRYPPGSRPPRPGTPPPWRPVARHAGILPAMHAGISPPLETCCKACWNTTCKARHAEIPPPPCGQTHSCKNITFATSLRTVTRKHSSRMRTSRFGGHH